MTEREQVEAFHRAMGLPVRERPEMPSEAERRLRARLVLEECFELIQSLGFDVVFGGVDLDGKTLLLEPNGQEDLTAMAQENADVRVITLGTDLACGFPPEVLVEVMRANMRKVGPDGKPVRREDGKVIKPPGFVPADVAGVLARAAHHCPSCEGIHPQSCIFNRSK